MVMWPRATRSATQKQLDQLYGSLVVLVDSDWMWWEALLREEAPGPEALLHSLRQGHDLGFAGGGRVDLLHGRLCE